MPGFPRTMFGDVSVSRMIIGTNWFLGYTHCTGAKSKSVERIVTNPKSIADIIEVFLRAGVDTIMCPHTETCMFDAIREAEQRVGAGVVIISTPSFPVDGRTPVDGFDEAECARILDAEDFVRQRLIMLLEGKVGYVIGGLRQMLVKHRRRLGAQKRKTLHTVINYYACRRQWMRYDQYIAAGIHGEDPQERKGRQQMKRSDLGELTGSLTGYH